MAVTVRKTLGCFILLVLFFLTAFCLVSRAAEDSAEYQEGILLLGGKNFQAAAEKFQTVVKAEPANANASYYLGEAYSGTGEDHKAISAYQETLELDSGLHECHLKRGLAYYRVKEYQKALAELEKASSAASDQGLVCYYQGLAYFHLQKYHLAIPLLARAAELNSNLTSFTDYWQGVSFYNEGVYRQSVACLEKVAAGPDDFPLKKSALEFLADAREGMRPWALEADFWLEYDDNVTLQPESSSPATLVSGKEDWRTAVSLRAAFHHFRDEGAYGATYSFYESSHNELSAYNLQGHNISAFFYSNSRPVQPFIQCIYAFYFLDQARYLEKESIVPAVNITCWNPLVVQLFWRHEVNDYFSAFATAAQNQDSNNDSLGVTFYRPFWRNRAYFYIGAEYENNAAEGANWDYDGVKEYLTLSFPFFFPKTSIKFKFEYNDRGFSRVDSLFFQKRSDEMMTVFSEILYRASQKLDIALNFQHIRNDSNIDSYEYRRNITSLFFAYHF